MINYNEEASRQMETYYTELIEAEDSATRTRLNKAMLNLCEKFPILRKMWSYLSEKRKIVERWVKNSASQVKTAIAKQFTSARIKWEAQPMSKDVNQFYLIDLLDEDGNVVWSKIGTTTRDTWERMQEHLRYYKRYGVHYLEVKRVYDCGDNDPEILEGIFRKFYKNKFGKDKYVPNDRFTERFDFAEADEKFNKALATVNAI